MYVITHLTYLKSSTFLYVANRILSNKYHNIYSYNINTCKLPKQIHARSSSLFLHSLKIRLLHDNLQPNEFFKTNTINRQPNPKSQLSKVLSGRAKIKSKKKAKRVNSKDHKTCFASLHCKYVIQFQYVCATDSWNIYILNGALCQTPHSI